MPKFVQVFHFFIREAAWIAHHYERINPNTTYVSTQILVVIWEVFSDLRFVFWVLWKKKIVKKINEDKPELIKQMLDRGFRAMYICQHLCSILVCII